MANRLNGNISGVSVISIRVIYFIYKNLTSGVVVDKILVRL